MLTPYHMQEVNIMNFIDFVKISYYQKIIHCLIFYIQEELPNTNITSFTDFAKSHMNMAY